MTLGQTISIIIPCLNEADNLVVLLPHLSENGGVGLKEIIVVDAGGCQQTMDLCVKHNAVYTKSDVKSRAAQQNRGAQLAQGNVFYFVHADSLPPKSYVQDILESIQAGFSVGCYRFKFRSDKLLLKVNSYFTRFDRMMCRGGDQTLFVKADLFRKLEGFNPRFVIMEDYDFIKRVKPFGFKIIPKDVLVSPRKYEHNSYFRVNLANFTVFMLYFARIEPIKLKMLYNKLIRHPKA